MSILSKVGQNVVAGAAPQIEGIIQRGLAAGKADASELATEVIGELQTAFDTEVGHTFDRVDSIVARLENLIGWMGEQTKDNRIEVAISVQVVPKV